MTNANSSTKRLPSLATLALGGAAILATASIGVAAYRASDGEEAAAPGPHGQAKPDEPVASVEQQIAKLEERLRTDPDNAEGWRMLGWSYFELGDLARSASAYRRAAQVEPNKAENWSSLGEALQSASRTMVPEAAEAFDRAIKLDPADPRARYFLAVQKDMTGDHAGAIEDWIALLKDTPPGAPWEGDLRRTILQVGEREKIEVASRLPAPSSGSVATAAIPGPSAQQMAAASSIPPSQQDEMVRGMVDGLAARLAANPRDADGWIRLMRSRMVLGERDRAREALASGLQAFAGDSRTQGRLRSAAQELGVPSGG